MSVSNIEASKAHQTREQDERFVAQTARFIYNRQLPNGAIPWEDERHVDPWNHVEAAMGLSIGGQLEAAVDAYKWLQDYQLDNGGWWAKYQNDRVEAQHMESNFIAYIATGVWHHYLISEDSAFLELLWGSVERALDCVLRYQHGDGAISWQIDADGRSTTEALLSGCASIHRSLSCGIAIAHTLGVDKPDWIDALNTLGERLRNPNARFMDKSRYSMDWFYPILSGALPLDYSRRRIEQFWDKFIVPDRGCRCVADEPWVAVAESCELVMALQAIGERKRALDIYRLLHAMRDEYGAYWTGYQYRLDIPWPREKPTWTAAAVLLAYDALYDHTCASKLFLSPATTQ